MNETEDEYRRRNTEWLLVQAIRELRGIAIGGPMPTYYHVLGEAQKILPNVFNNDSPLIQREHQPELVEKYKQEANALSIQQVREVQPLELVDKRIAELEQAIRSTQDSNLLKKELDKLKAIRPIFTKKPLTEDFIIRQDLQAERKGFTPLNLGPRHADFSLSDDRTLRIRVIHPDGGEQSLGADLIYEKYWQEKELVRFAHIQYKIWDGKTLLWTQAPNLQNQLNKLKKHVCGKKFCCADNGKNVTDEYRLPYCSAFLRPTDHLQHKDSSFRSSGEHLAVCKIDDLVEKTQQGNNKLTRNAIRSNSISHHIFEELFAREMVGSRWLTYEEAEKMYKKHKILDQDERIIIHAQEFRI